MDNLFFLAKTSEFCPKIYKTNPMELWARWGIILGKRLSGSRDRSKAFFLFLFTSFELLTLWNIQLPVSWFLLLLLRLRWVLVPGLWNVYDHTQLICEAVGFSNSQCWKTHRSWEIKLMSLSCAEKVWTALSNELPPSPFFQAASYTGAVTSHLPFEQLWYNCCFIAYRRVSVRNQKLVFQLPWPGKVLVTGLHYWWMHKESWQDYERIWTHSSGLKVANWPNGNTRGSIFQPWTSAPR